MVDDCADHHEVCRHTLADSATLADSDITTLTTSYWVVLWFFCVGSSTLPLRLRL